jgi:tripartite ATP-independent transporter DctM subunit
MGIYIPVILAFVLLFLGVPVAVSLLSSAIVYFAFITDTMPLTMIVQKMVSSNMSYALLAVPFFILAGLIMNSAGITQQMMRFCDLLLGHKVGGLAQVNVLLSTINGGICGSGAADAAMQCKILVPEMSKRGYPRAFSAAVTAASSLIAPMIPPGVALILYGVMTETSIGKMFVAGIVPGILMCIAEMVVVVIISRKNKYPPSRDHKAPAKEVLLSLKDSIWALIVPIVIIGGLRAGLFTATEGAALIIVVSMLVGFFIYKVLNPKELPGILKEAFRSTSSIMFMILSAVVFGMYLSWARIPQNITAWMLAFTNSPAVFMMIATVLLLVFGMFISSTSLLMIMTPLLFPVAQAYGINAVQFGILIILNCAVGSLTPPLGGVMYLVCKMCNVTIVQFVKHVWPFILALIILIGLIMAWPQLTTFLPDLIYS